MRTGDSTLLRAWIEHRDAQAFAEIVRRYAGLVYGSSLRILASPPDAEDVSQECFLALAGAEGPGPRSLPCWLHAVATRQARKRIRGDRNRKIREDAQAEREKRQSEPVWDDIESYVDEAIEELPENLRHAVTAHFLLQRTHRSIARELGVTRQAISYRITQGVEQIRRGLQGRGISAPAALLGALLGAQACVAAPSSLSASLGKLAIAGTPGHIAPPVGTTWSLNVPLLKWGALSLAALGVAGTSIFVLRPEEAPETALRVASNGSPVMAAVSRAEASLLESVSIEASPIEPDPPADSLSEFSTIQEAGDEPTVDRIVSGRVYDMNTSLPISNAKVVAEHRSVRRSRSGLSITTVHTQHGETDSMGIFRIARLMAKRYTLQVYIDQEDVVGEGQEVDLRLSDEIRGVDIGVTVPPPEGARIEGFVTYGEAYVSETIIKVAYDPIRKEGLEELVSYERENPVSGSKGSYLLGEMAEGVVMLTAQHAPKTHPGMTHFIDVLREGIVVRFTQSSISGRITQFVDLVAGETYVVDFDFPVSAEAALMGRISPAPEGDECVVRAYIDNRDGVSVEWSSPVTPQGYYFFAGLPAGVFEVVTECISGPAGEFVVAPDGSVRILSGEIDVVRLSSGLWTDRGSSLVLLVDQSAERSDYYPRQYYAGFTEAVRALEGLFSLQGYFGSDLVTVESGTVARLDFDFNDRANQ